MVIYTGNVCPICWLGRAKLRIAKGKYGELVTQSCDPCQAKVDRAMEEFLKEKFS